VTTLGPGDAHPHRSDIAVVTVIRPEYDAMQARLENPTPIAGSLGAPNAHAWLTGEISRPGRGRYQVVLALAGRPGTASAMRVVEETISRFRPRYVVIVGIAGGLPREGLATGDVVISSVIWAYEHGKLAAGGFHPRPDFTYPVDTALINAAQSLGDEWKDDIAAPAPEGGRRPKALCGPIASGDKVVDDVSGAFFAKIREAWPKLQAADMEGAGAAAAVQWVNERGWPTGLLMIRGISDMPGSGGADPAAAAQTAERDAWTARAAAAAASFMAYLVRRAWPIDPLFPPAPAISPFQTAGTLSADHPTYVHRPCDDALLAAVRRARLIVVQGDHQMGKSSLSLRTCARLPHAAYVDLQLLRVEDATLFFDGFFEKLSEDLGFRITSWEQVRPPSPSERLVLFIDELGYLVDVKELELFRRFIQPLHNRAVSVNNTCVVVCLKPAVDAILDRVGSVRRKVYDGWDRIEVPAFDDAEVARLIRFLPPRARGVALAETPRVLERTGGAPREVQTLFDELFAAEIGGADTARLAAILDGFVPGRQWQ
jgi:nucleoside phosphorylase